jgi:phosphoribosyl-dephospho-CoA transferase
MAARVPSTHDLLRLRGASLLMADALVPYWVGRALARAPWVVVRRGHVLDGIIPVCVRGLARGQRFAAFVSVAGVVERLTPEDLVARRPDPVRVAKVPALAALARVRPVLHGSGHRWGPGGSIGFEVATGLPAADAASDLDLVVRRKRRLDVGEAVELLETLIEAAAPAKVDPMVETPNGGVALADLAALPPHVPVRTPHGVRLSSDPWRAP